MDRTRRELDFPEMIWLEKRALSRLKLRRAGRREIGPVLAQASLDLRNIQNIRAAKSERIADAGRFLIACALREGSRRQSDES